MCASVAEYDATPAVTVDWDLQFQRVEQQVQAAADRKAQQPGG